MSHRADQSPISNGPETMQAIVQHRYGTQAELVLQLEELARPTIGDDEVLVRVAAASVDMGTWHCMTGMPYAMRLAGLRRPLAQGLQPGPGPRRNGRVRRQERDRVRAGRRGLRHLRRLLRRVRPRRDEHARSQAGEPVLRAGRGRPHLWRYRAAGRPQGERAAGAEGVDRRRVGRRRHLRRADRQGVRRRGHRRVQHREDRSGPSPRRRSRHRLHARRLRRRANTATT